MLPEEFVKRIKDQEYIDPDSLFKSLAEPSPVSIRINKSKWIREPLAGESVPWINNGYYLKSRPSYTFDPLFHSGCYYPQEASSMFLEQAVIQSAHSLAGIKVLDLCAAPGGKSTILADLIGNDSLLIANEVIRTRAAILAETITRWGVSNTIVTQNDPSAFGKLKGYFDMILVDAPCSGEGMFRSEVALDEWSTGNAAHCSERQKRILMDIWPSLKESGILIYSTCTFNPAENEENIKWLVNKQEAECIKLDISAFKGIKEIDFHGILGYGFYPDRVRGEGFFISVIRKTEKQKVSQIKNQRKASLAAGKIDLEAAERITNISRDRLVKWGSELIAAPCRKDDYISIYQMLRVVNGGTRLFTLKKNDLIPAHDLALSKLLKKDAFPRSEVSYEDAIAFLRRDNFNLKNSPKGWNIVTYKGVNLGFVKNIGERHNNYFPVGWRIRMNANDHNENDVISWTDIENI